MHGGKTDDHLVTYFCYDYKQLLPRKYKYFSISMSTREEIFKRERQVSRQISGHLSITAEILQLSPHYLQSDSQESATRAIIGQEKWSRSPGGRFAMLQSVLLYKNISIFAAEHANSHYIQKELWVLRVF